MMKNIAILFLLMVWFFTLSAQRAKDPVVDRMEVWKSGDSLMVALQIPLNKKLNSRNYKQIFTPVLYKDTLQMRLPEITVKTRRARILDARREISYGTATDTVGLFYQAGRDTLIDYAYSTLYQEWMEGSDFRLDRKICGCCSDSMLTPIRLAEKLHLLPDTVKKTEPSAPLLAEQLPRMIEQHVTGNPALKPVTRVWKFTNEDMIVYFRVNGTAVDVTLYDNQKVLEEIVRVVEQIERTPDMALNQIEITGYASPEGKIADNHQLAGERAAALKKYLQEKLSELGNNDFALKNGGENWEGLRKQVVLSKMPYKNKVLHIIDNVPVKIDYVNNTSRKKQLMDLVGGIPFNYMKKEFFESLRNACYISIRYDISPDPVADQVNGAIPLIREQNFEQALEMLLKVKDDSRAWNCIGVCYLFTAQYPQAEEYLQKAAAAGDKLAQKNLLLIPDKE